MATRNFSFALIAALCLHGLLLAQKLAFREAVQNKQSSLRVTMLKQETDQAEPDVKQQAIKPASPSIKLDDVIAVKPSNSNDVARIAIQTSPQSTSFKRWLSSETETFIRQNPDSMANFDTTFEESIPHQSPKELSPYHPKSISRGNTTFATEHKGKRTCMVRNINLLDISAGPSFVAKDCTTEKKFDLKLNRPNNGWSQR
ncbi:MAG: hypothetical protein JKX81_00360 [Arenicella sp.]|nr:hypothetical protein [Arenicella sp.]